MNILKKAFYILANDVLPLTILLISLILRGSRSIFIYSLALIILIGIVSQIVQMNVVKRKAQRIRINCSKYTRVSFNSWESLFWILEAVAPVMGAFPSLTENFMKYIVIGIYAFHFLITLRDNRIYNNVLFLFTWWNIFEIDYGIEKIQLLTKKSTPVNITTAKMWFDGIVVDIKEE